MSYIPSRTSTGTTWGGWTTTPGFTIPVTPNAEPVNYADTAIVVDGQAICDDNGKCYRIFIETNGDATIMSPERYLAANTARKLINHG